jgi:hypothetical protein
VVKDDDPTGVLRMPIRLCTVWKRLWFVLG